MENSTFQTRPYELSKLLLGNSSSLIFGGVGFWDGDRIKSLIASISLAFPVGALMTLNTGGPVNFKPRPVEGAPEATSAAVAPGVGIPTCVGIEPTKTLAKVGNFIAKKRRQYRGVCDLRSSQMQAELLPSVPAMRSGPSARRQPRSSHDWSPGSGRPRVSVALHA